MSPSPPHSPPAIFLQPTCHLHRFHRPSSTLHLSSIVERPERLRAIYTGLAAAHARLSLLSSAQSLAHAQHISAPSTSDDLVRALEGLGISKPPTGGHGGGEEQEGREMQVVVCQSPGQREGGARKVLRSKAVRFVHESEGEGVVGEGNGGKVEERYLEKLVKWGEEVGMAIKERRSEIPDGLPQGDLYLCTESLLAITGALTTTIQAVDTVIRSSRPTTTPIGAPPSPFFADSTLTLATCSQPLATPPLPTPTPLIQASTAFCAIRPPGHHCGEDDPMGFCFVNNVLVGAAHAYLDYDMDRAIVLDIDLHHGNGTQDIALRLNADTHHEELLVEGGMPAPADGKRGLKVFYGSVHDIYSFPCEDGNIDRIKDASISLASHGQYIENVHLSAYTSEQDFYARCYPKYLSLLTKAAEFLAATSGKEEGTMVFISAGFDASEHELSGMQRHGGRVPTSFYARFHADTVAFARQHAQGRVISVLEGGYGDRALSSGALASLVGLSDGGEGSKLAKAEEEGWWSVAQLTKLEKATKPPPRRKGSSSNPLAFPNPTKFAASAAADQDPWLARTIDLLHTIETNPLFPQVAPSAPASATSSPIVPGGGRTLRDRSAIQRTEKAGGGMGEMRETQQGSPRKKKVAALPTTAPAVKAASPVPAPTAFPAPAPAPAPVAVKVEEVVSPIPPPALPVAPVAPTSIPAAPPAPPAPHTLPSFIPPPPSIDPPPSPLSTALPASLLDAIALPTPVASLAPPPTPAHEPAPVSTPAVAPTPASEATLGPPAEPLAGTMAPEPKKIVLKFKRPEGSALSPPAGEAGVLRPDAEEEKGHEVARDSVDE